MSVPSENIILKSDPQVQSWPSRFLDHVLILYITFLKYISVLFHIVHGKMELIEKKVPLLILVVRVWWGEVVLHTIADHVLMALILLVLDEDFRISFPINSIKFYRSCII